MTARTTVHGLQVASNLHQFIEREVLPGTGIDAAAFWQGFAAIVHDLAPKNAALLAERDRLQREIDAWHRAHPGPIRDRRAYRAFLQQIGYLVPVPKRVRISTANVDDELARQAGPQLVVPVTNARYALNAANARWGSLYDALYGTDALPEDQPRNRHSLEILKAQVEKMAKTFEDEERQMIHAVLELDDPRVTIYAIASLVPNVELMRAIANGGPAPGPAQHLRLQQRCLAASSADSRVELLSARAQCLIDVLGESGSFPVSMWN